MIMQLRSVHGKMKLYFAKRKFLRRNDPSGKENSGRDREPVITG